MPPPIITVEGLSKSYTISHSHQAESAGGANRYRRLSEELLSYPRRLLSSFSRLASSISSTEVFWALKDVSFEVNEGEVVGIIGRNGAGKSTLLKVLSRITEPTAGRVTLRGRVASLLEVGTGFHPELTGRENIFLNGAILGMTRREVKRKFDEIVDFAGVERFLDTPVKRYSSGMYVRLAFAVAAHLEPEILVVDEVLAVGDAEFQKKCLGKMSQVATQGRTVIFVSHQMAAVENLCQRGMLLADGRIVAIGSINDVVTQYLKSGNAASVLALQERLDREGNGVLKFESVAFLSDSGMPCNAFASGTTAAIELRVVNQVGRALRNVRIAMGIDNDLSQRLFVLSTHLADTDLEQLDIECQRVTFTIPRLPLAPGRYGFTLFSSVNGEVADWVKNAGSFNVECGDFFGNGQVLPSGQGQFLIDHTVEVHSPLVSSTPHLTAE